MPFERGAELRAEARKTDSPVTPTQYKELIRGLLCLAVVTRPDIGHTISSLAQFNDKPGNQHWQAAKRVWKYIKGTASHQLTSRKSRPLPAGYVDAD